MPRALTHRPRLARLFMLLIAVLLLNCTLQPVMRMLVQFEQARQQSLPPAASTDTEAPSREEGMPSPCSLVGKLLSATQWSAIAPLLFAFYLLARQILAPPLSRCARPRLIPISPPERRLHLTLCNFRE